MTRILDEHTFPDRLRIRPVAFGPCEHGSQAYAAVAGAQLGGLDTGLEAVWRWLAFERLRAPFRDQLNEVRELLGDDYGRMCVRRLVAAFGVPWREVSVEVAAWQIEKVDRLPSWIRDRMFASEELAVATGFSDGQLDRLRRSIAFENVTEIQSAWAALRLYRERSVSDNPVPWEALYG